MVRIADQRRSSILAVLRPLHLFVGRPIDGFDSVAAVRARSHLFAGPFLASRVVIEMAKSAS
jgi:hypothetical protein